MKARQRVLWMDLGITGGFARSRPPTGAKRNGMAAQERLAEA
jgi:hypothetical protein